MQYLYSNRCNAPAKSLGASVAAKESVMQALCMGWMECSWKYIGIIGCVIPDVTLYGIAKELASELAIENVHVSLSHEEDKSIAFTISEIEE